MAKILVVDDLYGIRRMLLDTLREEKYEVEIARNGAEALRQFISFMPNLILMDIKMPGMDGIETLRQIRALNSQVAVIMMTAYRDTQKMDKAQDLGILDYMSKPFNLPELMEKVRKILKL